MHKCMKIIQSPRFDDAIEKCPMLKGHLIHKLEGYYNMWIERCEYMKTQDHLKIGMVCLWRQLNDTRRKIR